MLADTFEQIHNIDIADTAEHTHINQVVDAFLNNQQQQYSTAKKAIHKTCRTRANSQETGYDNIDNTILKNLSKKK